MSQPAKTTAQAAARIADAASGAPGQDLALRREQAEAYLNLIRIHRLLERRVGELFTDEGLREITPAQASALMVLFQQRRALTARELARQLGLSEVTVGRFVKALVERGWVTRSADPKDQRAMLLRPTVRARRNLPRFIAVFNALIDEAFHGVNAAAVHKIACVTRVLVDNLEE